MNSSFEYQESLNSLHFTEEERPPSPAGPLRRRGSRPGPLAAPSAG